MNKFYVSYLIVATYFFLQVIAIVLLALFSKNGRQMLFSATSLPLWIGVILFGYLYYTLRDWRICQAVEMAE